MKIMKIINNLVSLFLLVGMVALSILVISGNAKASTPSGLPATMATTSTVTVGPSNVASTTPTTGPRARLFVATLNCASRIITTSDTAIRLSFADMSSSTPSGSVGHFQATSTSVVYDSGQYGCGLVTAYGYFASSTVTVSELK